MKVAHWLFGDIVRRLTWAALLGLVVAIYRDPAWGAGFALIAYVVLPFGILGWSEVDRRLRFSADVGEPRFDNGWLHLPISTAKPAPFRAFLTGVDGAKKKSPPANIPLGWANSPGADIDLTGVGASILVGRVLVGSPAAPTFAFTPAAPAEADLTRPSYRPIEVADPTTGLTLTIAVGVANLDRWEQVTLRLIPDDDPAVHGVRVVRVVV